MHMEHMLSQNVDRLFSFSYDPLKQMLVLIVQNLQEHKEIIDKLRSTVGYEEDLMMGTEDFYNNPPLKEPNQINQHHIEHSHHKFINSEQNRTFEDLIEEVSQKLPRENIQLNRSVDRVQNSNPDQQYPTQKLESFQVDDLVYQQQKPGLHNHSPKRDKFKTHLNIVDQTIGGGLRQQQYIHQPHFQQRQPKAYNQSNQPKLSFDLMKQNASHVSNNQQILSVQQNNLQAVTARTNNQKGVIPDMARKLEFLETRLSQQDSIINGLKNQIKPDTQREKQIELEKKELKDKLNQLSIRVSTIENYTEFLRQDQDQLSTVINSTSPTKNISVTQEANPNLNNTPTNNFSISPIKGGSDDQQSTIQMIQNFMLRTRKDIQERFDTQLRNLEQRVVGQLENLQNWVMNNQNGGEDYENPVDIKFISPRGNASINIDTNDSLIKENSEESRIKQTDSGTNLNNVSNPNIAISKVKPFQGGLPMNGGNNNNFRMPLKYVHEIKDLQKSSEKYDSKITELFERWSISDRILTKINDYYEANLRAISVKNLGEQLKEFDKILQQKADILEVKKLLSAIHECNDKFNWLEERYKQERRDQESIIQNMQLVQKNLNIKASNSDQRINALEKKTEDFTNDVKTKLQSSGWMSNMNAGPSAEMLRMQSDQQEEMQRQNELKFNEIQTKMAKISQETLESNQSLRSMVTNKVGQKALDDAEDRMQKIVDKVISNVNKRFMEKNEIKKMLSQFESQFEGVFETLFQKFDDQDVNEAMLAKKPLGGWSCVSCQKSIGNMSGNLAEHQVTNKLPARDPTERLHKVKGFGKLISSIGMSGSGNLSSLGKEDNQSENLRYKGNRQGVFAMMQTSPKRNDLMFNYQQQIQETKEEKSQRILDKQGFPNSTQNFILVPKLKNAKQGVGSLKHSQSQQRVSVEVSQNLQGLQIDTMIKETEATSYNTSSPINILPQLSKAHKNL